MLPDVYGCLRLDRYLYTSETDMGGVSVEISFVHLMSTNHDNKLKLRGESGIVHFKLTISE